MLWLYIEETLVVLDLTIHEHALLKQRYNIMCEHSCRTVNISSICCFTEWPRQVTDIDEHCNEKAFIILKLCYVLKLKKTSVSLPMLRDADQTHNCKCFKLHDLYES